MKTFRNLAIVSLFTALAACNSVSWQPAGDRIMTEWGENLDPTAVHQEYPRPQMVRDAWKNLNGMWNYAITSADAADSDCTDGQILVPFAVESSLSGVGRIVSENEALWYQREFTVPFSWKSDRVKLNFGAVDWHAQVYVDGNLVGEHKGGYSPFSFDITDALASGRNHTLKVKVLDAADKSWQPRGKQISNPHGIWYTTVTGIWQTVWMEPVAQSHVNSYFAVSDIDNKVLKVDVDAVMQEDEVCKVTLLDNGAAVASAEGQSVTLDVPDMKLWSPDSPYLYNLEIAVMRDGKEVDKVKGYTAMRKISYSADADGHKRMLLNNKTLFQYGPLDQGWWPDGLYTAPCDEALLFDIVKTKEMGFNMIRKHVKVEPARWYWHCDRIGMLVWQDMPSTFDNKFNGWKYNDFNLVDDKDVFPADGVENYYREWSEIIETKKTFPCIVVWVPFNEGWGQFNTQDVVTATREFDSTRLINYASGGNFYRECDAEIFDLHHYPNPKMFLYDENKVNVLGEYGGIGWPVEGHLWQTDKNWGYIQYKSADDVLKTYEEYAQQLSELVKQGFAAAVYTQTTDVEGEVNGLMTYDRKVVKLDMEKLSAINRKVIATLE